MLKNLRSWSKQHPILAIMGIIGLVATNLALPLILLLLLTTPPAEFDGVEENN